MSNWYGTEWFRRTERCAIAFESGARRPRGGEGEAAMAVILIGAELTY
jgi:hypothetical protein